MTREEVFEQVKSILVETLSVDEDKVTPGGALPGGSRDRFARPRGARHDDGRQVRHQDLRRRGRRHQDGRRRRRLRHGTARARSATGCVPVRPTRGASPPHAGGGPSSSWENDRWYGVCWLWRSSSTTGLLRQVFTHSSWVAERGALVRAPRVPRRQRAQPLPSRPSSTAGSPTSPRAVSRGCAPTSSAAPPAPGSPRGSACRQDAACAARHRRTSRSSSTSSQANENILADMTESLIGAIYLTFGFDAVRPGRDRGLHRAHLVRRAQLRRLQDRAAGAARQDGPLGRLPAGRDERAAARRASS